jgi:N-acetylglucosaminyldiphosphoundecaprenol N-acetyl-beta-D-mannosaminyltransferase
LTPIESLEQERASAHVNGSGEAPRTVNVLGVRFHSVSFRGAIEAIEKLIQDRKPSQVVLANAYTVALCRKDPHFRQQINRATLVLADGMSIVWGGQWVGAKVPERVPGPDLMEALCRWAARRGQTIFLMGSTEHTLQILSDKLIRICPELRIAGTYSPAMCDKLSEEENIKIIELLIKTNPDLLFVGMSCPKQERWIAENLHRLPVPVALGVGASFDFLSGKIRRAPRWLRHIGLEWVYRLCQEPQRLWRRYLLGNAVFLSSLLKEAIKGRHSA